MEIIAKQYKEIIVKQDKLNTLIKYGFVHTFNDTYVYYSENNFNLIVNPFSPKAQTKNILVINYCNDYIDLQEETQDKGYIDEDNSELVGIILLLQQEGILE